MLASVDLPGVENLIQRNTDGRVCDLEVEFLPGRVVLRGRTETYYVKQLAQHALRHLLPTDCELDNLIVVRNTAQNPLRYFDLFPSRELFFDDYSPAVSAATV